ncbi:RNA polymerase sigma factor (sigma-70 family) [Neolewinella xylanilytica]|uniref:RNA polymerase sigma factor (Sigma-70 family) n=1 Tax=Neolewinella xylanilytica TaxID=1514080 RepID=A0A2S6I1E7_9BACT|nr:sigma-70 family RNA polymerase sigma factor [Neolewinella xylanilytica]PPK84784.1 RNA polymerase sigma factor (sigma-70 family) [Neolewinella xylanilytica]
MQTQLEDTTLFEAIKRGDHHLIDQLYLQHRDAFVTYAQRQLYATEADAADCFQDAVIAFYKNIVSGKLQELTCSIRTYLFSIGKRLVYRRNKKRQREPATDHEAGINPADELDWSLIDRFEHAHQQEVLQTAMNKIGSPCREILTLYYYHHYPIESITESVGLPSDGATRIKKMRCLKELKKLVKP